jgi:UDP-N-acetylmuramate dehydrogenase
MVSHCSLRAGGLAQDFFMPDNIQTLINFLKSNTKPLLFIGLGSNLLIRDQGFNGVIVKLTQLKSIEINRFCITAQAGVTLSKLSRFVRENNLYGAEFLNAIPGTIGGALAMNAGAFGAEFWQFVKCVHTVNTSGECFQRLPSEFEINYRHVNAVHTDEHFISAELEFSLTPSGQNIQQLLQRRSDSQPIGLPSCGSVFKNPTGHYAAELIEKSDLKGVCMGGACISNKHANFIINQNKASATDIENLILHIQQTVKSKFNIDLETELKII